MTLFVSDIINSRASNVTGNPTPSSSLQWKRNGESIENAVASQYTVVPEDEGKIISVTQTSTSFAGTKVRTSASLGPVSPNPSGLFSENEQGVWYDPGDFNRYMQTGPGLITNGTFDAGVNGWTATNASITSIGGVARITSTISGTGARVGIQTVAGLIVGRTYQVAGFAVGSGGAGVKNAKLEVRQTAGTLVQSNSVDNPTTPTFLRLTFIATETSHGIWLRFDMSSGDTSSYVEFDNISIRELVAISTSSMFQDHSGTTPVTAVEQPVGLMLDKRLGLVLGTNQVLNGDFSAGTTNWITGSGVSISGGAASSSGALTNANENLLIQDLFSTAEKLFECRATVTRVSGGFHFRPGGVNSAVVAESGEIVRRVRAGAANAFRIVTAAGGFVGSIDNISVREIPGNHAFQTTTADRPILRNRYNLLTKTEKFTDPVWGRATSNGTAWPVVTDNYATDPLGGFSASRIQLTLPGDTEWSLVRTVASLANIPIGASVTTSLWIKAANESQIGKFISLYAYNVSTASYAVGNMVSKHVLTGEWQRVQASFSFISVSATQEFSIGKARSIVNNGLLNAETATDFLVWGAQFVFTDQSNIPYQWVDTATVYDSDTSKFPLYLACNGTNTSMQTNNIDFTGTDKVTVFTGMRKLSDATTAIFMETSVNSLTTPGTLAIIAPNQTNVPWIQARSHGTTPQSSNIASLAAPISFVTTLTANISAPILQVRINGTTRISNNGTQGTGNYGNYPLYLFRRAGTTLPFNGNFYGLIIRGTLTTQTRIEQSERWMAKRTGITLP